MASPKLFFSLVLISLFSVYVSCSSSEDQGTDVQSGLYPSDKVELALYYETLCPYCAKFIVKELIKVLDSNFMDIVNLRLVPYGNAHIQQPDNTVVCQHGPDECYLNSIEACAINSWPDVKQHFKFIHCVENKTIEGKESKEDSWKSCCQKLGLDPKPVQDCYDSGLEKMLILQYANDTEHLFPPHIYVPWVVVNSKPLRDDYQNFVSYVCKAYKGSPKPDICRPPPPKINSTGNSKSTGEVCYKGDEHRK